MFIDKTNHLRKSLIPSSATVVGFLHDHAHIITAIAGGEGRTSSLPSLEVKAVHHHQCHLQIEYDRRSALLQNTFVVSTGKISLVSALQADTIYTI
jgi:hypothetical protein